MVDEIWTDGLFMGDGDAYTACRAKIFSRAERTLGLRREVTVRSHHKM
jgi:hypothetical protein